LEESDQGRQSRAEQSCILKLFGDLRLEGLVATGTTLWLAVVLLNGRRNFRQFNLLVHARLSDIFECTSTTGTLFVSPFPVIINLLFPERSSLMARVSWLPTDLSLLRASWLLVLASWINNVARRGFRRVAGIFLG